MSTSIAQLPAYKPTKTTRTKAVVDRTIFGTTLDSHDKCKNLLNNDEALLEAQALYAARYKKHRTPTPRTKRLYNRAWGIKDFTQSEIGEEIVRNYSQLSNYSDKSIDTPSRPHSVNLHDSSLEINNTVNKRAATALGFNPHVHKNIKSQNKRRPKTTSTVKTKETMDPRRENKRTKSGQNFYLPPGARNYMRIASLKITETGAKDLINSKSINKLGFGDTLQYNYDTIKPRDKPQAYKNHGHVLQMGQKFMDDTTNRSATGPGSCYQLSSRERSFNERYQDSLNGSAAGFTDSFREDLALRNRRTFDKKEEYKRNLNAAPPNNSTQSGTRKSNKIPLNIRHKFGEEEIEDLFKNKEREIEEIMSRKGTNMKHSGILPPRSRIHELNHPISPHVKYYSNYGQSLKADKFEGGLHLYIK